MTYSAICHLYVHYVKSNYKNAVVLSDGYEGGPSTKDTAHLRRARGCTSTPAKFTEDMTLTLKKDLFLKNKENKQTFIKMLDKKLQSFGFRVFHADDDADVLIVKRSSRYYKPQTRLLLEMIPTYLFFYFITPETLNLRYILSSRTQADFEEKAHHCQHQFSCQKTWYGTV